MERGTDVTQAVGYHQHPEAVPAPPVPKVATVQTSSTSGHTAAGVVWPEAELLSTRGLWYTVVVVQSLSHVLLFATPRTAARRAPLSSTVSWSLLRFMFIESVMLSNYLILCHPLVLLPSIFPGIRVFYDKLALLGVF